MRGILSIMITIASDKNCVRLSFTFVFPATLKRSSLPGRIKMVREIERTEPLLTLPLSGQAAFRSKTVAFAFDFSVFFRQLLLSRHWHFLDSGRDEDRCWSMYRSCGWCTVCGARCLLAFIIVQSRQLQFSGSPQPKYQIGSIGMITMTHRLHNQDSLLKTANFSWHVACMISDEQRIREEGCQAPRPQSIHEHPKNQERKTSRFTTNLKGQAGV